MTGQSGRSGKRKALHTQPIISQKGTNVMAISSQSQPKIGKGTKEKGVRTNSFQKGTKVIGVQSNLVGQSKNNGVFVLRSAFELGPYVFSSPFNNKDNPKDTEMSSASEFSGNSDGRQREMGDFLQRKGDSSGGGDNSLDKARSNRGIGMVQARSDGGVEEYVPINGEKQAVGVFTNERRSMDHDSELMVEVLDGSTSNAGVSGDKLKIISHRIRHAELGKISVRNGSGIDRAKSRNKKEIVNQSGGMLVDGQSTHGENDPICRTSDEWHGTNQGYPGRDGDNKAFGDSIPRDLGVEEGVVGVMEVERH